MWEQKLGEEQEKTQPLEQVCAALREDLDIQHKKRMEALEIKMKPIIIKDSAGRVAYDSKKGDFRYETHVIPDYVWFNGTVNGHKGVPV